MATDIKVNQKFKEFDSLVVHLRNQKSKTDQNKNLHKHITELMNHIVIHCPDDALNKLEEISYLLKHGDTLAIEDFLKVNEKRVYSEPASGDTVESTESVIESSQKFFKVSTILCIYNLSQFTSETNYR